MTQLNILENRKHVEVDEGEDVISELHRIDLCRYRNKIHRKNKKDI